MSARRLVAVMAKSGYYPWRNHTVGTLNNVLNATPNSNHIYKIIFMRLKEAFLLGLRLQALRYLFLLSSRFALLQYLQKQQQFLDQLIFQKNFLIQILKLGEQQEFL